MEATFVEQVGGDHYLAPYQHWDWAAETQLGGLEWNATKYLARFRKKGSPRLDLEKALSYVEKAIVLADQLTFAGSRIKRSNEKLQRFLRSSGLEGSPEAELIMELDGWLSVGSLRSTAQGIRELINDL